MKEYTLKIPITGYVEIVVDAEDENAAINKAFDMAELEDLSEWNLHKEINDENCVLKTLEICED